MASKRRRRESFVKQLKINIQMAFQQKMGLVVDFPNCRGSGTSNNGCFTNLFK